jgi:hypothetical protein
VLRRGADAEFLLFLVARRRAYRLADLLPEHDALHLARIRRRLPSTFSTMSPSCTRSFAGGTSITCETSAPFSGRLLADRLTQLRRHRLHQDADVGARHLPFSMSCTIGRAIASDTMTDPGAEPGDHRVDADDLAVEVHERTARCRG